MVSFTALIQKYDANKDKTGWTYVVIPSAIAQQIKPNYKKEFKVKGKLDSFPIARVAIMPMGGGDYILPLNATLRKGIGKKQGAMLKLQLAEDKSEFVFNEDFMVCLNDEPLAKAFFETLSGSHQRYFSKWIDEAKTIETKTKRIAMAVNGLLKKMEYGEMIRANRKS